MLNSQPTERAPHPRRPFQFSIRGLLALTTLVAIGLAILFGMPGWVAGMAITLLAVVLPAILTVVLVYGDSYQRTFCIGALFPAGTALFSVAWPLGILAIDGPRSPDRILEFLEAVGTAWAAFAGCSWVLTLLMGMVAVTLRLWLERGQGQPGRDHATHAPSAGSNMEESKKNPG